MDDEGADAKPAPSDESEEPKAVEINGSVLDGLGLEPLPVARFTMIEETEVGDDDDLDLPLYSEMIENQIKHAQ